MSPEVQTRGFANKKWGGMQKSIFGGKNMMGGIGNGLRSHPNAADNRYKARSVLGWGTAWEALRVPLAF